jgi:hypothetical protein
LISTEVAKQWTDQDAELELINRLYDYILRNIVNELRLQSFSTVRNADEPERSCPRAGGELPHDQRLPVTWTKASYKIRETG